jgi:two-component system, cell cycle response regulator
VTPTPLAKVFAKDLSAGERSALMSLFRLSRGRGVQFELADQVEDCFAAIADGSANDSVHWIVSLPELMQRNIIWMGQAPYGWPSAGVFVIARPISWPRLLVRLESQWREQQANPQAQQQPPLAMDLPPPRPLSQIEQHPARLASILDRSLISPSSVSHRAFARTEPDSTPRYPTVQAVQSAEPQHDPGQTTYNTDSQLESPLKALNVLVVDDQALARHALAKSLNFFSVTPLEAESAEAALRITQHTVFDLIFLDVNMPGQDGYSLCKDFKRSRGPHADAMVVMVTSRDGLIDKLRGTLAGADHFLTKPASPLDVEPILKKSLEKHMKAVKEGRIASLR